MVRLSDDASTSALNTAKKLAAQGLQVFPARYRDKPPIVPWKEFQSKKVTPALLKQWFSNRGALNYWVLTGRMSGYIVIDIDSQAGQDWWREHFDYDLLERTAQDVTAKGVHYWFKIPEGWTEEIRSWSVHPKKNQTDDISFDFRADGTGVIVPPSVHDTGFVYEWVVPLSEALEAPAALLDGSLASEAPRPRDDAEEGTAGTGGGTTRSMLSKLLSNSPGGEGTGRNEWLVRVAGHYAKTYHNQEDLYLAHVQQANSSMGTPLSSKEFDKTVGSVWKGEHERHRNRSIDGSTGFLASGGSIILCQVSKKHNDDVVFELEEYADFDLKALGVMIDDSSRRTYWVQIVRKRRGGDGDEVIDAVVPGSTLGDDRAFRKWLAGFACTIVPPESMWPKSGSTGARVQRYLEAQAPSPVTVSPWLGFDRNVCDGGGGFITHEGVITFGGLVDFETAGVRPNPGLLTGGTAPHAYGFEGDHATGQSVLEEVLTFHDETVTSVFGAWWAACLLKPQIEERTSLFPFIAIEAPSESGKTNGFFEMMTELNGNTRGETQPTKAALRDMAAAHRNGIVWVDDLDDPAYLMELLRAATSGGSLTKMGEDREHIVNTQIVSPIVISGEALGLGTQKALLDRSVTLKVGSPVGRMSARSRGVPQWNDVLALKERYPDGLSAVAGWLVQDALGAVDRTLEALKEGRDGGSGRAADKVAILRAGARLLDWLTTHDEARSWSGRGSHAQRVESWVETQFEYDIDGTLVMNSNENALTLKLLPWALRTMQFPEKAFAGQNGQLDTPVYVKSYTHIDEDGQDPFLDDSTEVWFNTSLLAQAWERERHGRIERRTETEAALKDQANVLHARAKRVKLSGGGGRLAYYRGLKGQLAIEVVRRAWGQ